MIHLLIYLLPLLTMTQEFDCTNLKSGTFTTTNVHGTTSITTTIKREGEYQYELCEQLGLEIKFRVEWIDPCKYTLTWVETIKDSNNYGYPEDMVLTIVVTEVTADYYIQTTTSDFSDLIVEGKVEIVK